LRKPARGQSPKKNCIGVRRPHGAGVVAQAFQPNAVALRKNGGAFVSWIEGRSALSSEGAARRSPRRSSDPLAGRCGVWGCVPKGEEPRRGGTSDGCRLFEAPRDFERTPDCANGVAGAPPPAPSGATHLRRFAAENQTRLAPNVRRESLSRRHSAFQPVHGVA